MQNCKVSGSCLGRRGGAGLLRVGRFSLESRFWERFGKTLPLLSRTGAGIFVQEPTV